MTTKNNTFRICTWNCAAINDNPFEYYVTIDGGDAFDIKSNEEEEKGTSSLSSVSNDNNNDNKKRLKEEQKRYERTMEKIDEQLLDRRTKNGLRAMKISDLLTNEMIEDLRRSIFEGSCATKDTWTHREFEECLKFWEHGFKDKLVIEEFLLNDEIGSKRLCSMPDRLTTKITLKNDGDGDESVIVRPCVTTSYADVAVLSDDKKWWEQWLKFVFMEKNGAIKNIKFLDNKKYPAITDEEVKISRPLQLFCLAAFDKSLIKLIQNADENWAETKKMLVDALVDKKIDATVQILENISKDKDCICLQEVSGQMREAMSNSAILSEKFDCLSSPDFDSVRNQNSMVLASKAFFKSGIWEVVNIDSSKLPAGVANGDLCVVREIVIDDADDISTTQKRRKPFTIASFHGDTNGLQTVDVVKAVNKECNDTTTAPSTTTLVFALDANSHYDDNKGKRLSCEQMFSAFSTENLANAWGSDFKLCPTTTCNARTFLQPQLNKAVFYRDKLTSKLVDRHPKDHVLFSKASFAVIESKTTRSNDCVLSAPQKMQWLDDCPFPTLSFPSDHALCSFELEYY